MYTVGSLFSGIGGIDLAFNQAGFDIRWQVEIDDYCNKILERHWPGVQRWRDNRTASSADLPRVDVMVGGFPCQDISVAGRGDGIREGNRSGLWFEFGRLIGDLRPRVVLLENVSAILVRDGVRVISDLAALGYDCEWGIIRASDAGAPHQRERWFCVAYSMQPGSSSERIEAYQQQSSTDPTIASGGAQMGGLQSPMDDTKHGGCEGWNSQGTGASSTLSSNQELAHTHKQHEGYGQDGTCCLFGNGTTKDEGVGSTIQSYRNGAIESVLGRAVDGLSAGMDRSQWPVPPGSIQHEWESSRVVGKLPNRAARLKALGNAVVPQVIYPIAVSIREWLQAQDEIAH